MQKACANAGSRKKIEPYWVYCIQPYPALQEVISTTKPEHGSHSSNFIVAPKLPFRDLLEKVMPDSPSITKTQPY